MSIISSPRHEIDRRSKAGWNSRQTTYSSSLFDVSNMIGCVWLWRHYWPITSKRWSNISLVLSRFCKQKTSVISIVNVRVQWQKECSLMIFGLLEELWGEVKCSVASCGGLLTNDKWRVQYKTVLWSDYQELVAGFLVLHQPITNPQVTINRLRTGQCRQTPPAPEENGPPSYGRQNIFCRPAPTCHANILRKTLVLDSRLREGAERNVAPLLICWTHLYMKERHAKTHLLCLEFRIFICT
jgi:hypothetical protein